MKHSVHIWRIWWWNGLTLIPFHGSVQSLWAITFINSIKDTSQVTDEKIMDSVTHCETSSTSVKPCWLRAVNDNCVNVVSTDCVVSLWYLACGSRTALWRAQGRVDEFGFLCYVPLCAAAGYDGVGASVHHAGVEAVGHGEGFQVAL